MSCEIRTWKVHVLFFFYLWPKLKLLIMIKILNLLFFAGMVVVNYLANALPINGKTTGQLSDNFPNLFVPAGITFSIWGIIYILLLVFCVIQFNGSNQLTLARIGWLFIISCVLNGLWIFTWHYGRVGLSVLIMLGLLATLVFVNYHFKDLQTGWIKATFGIYLGWICIATIANVTALMVTINWNGFGLSAEIWSVVMIVIGAIIVSVAIFRFNNPYIGLSVVWAFIGIVLKRQADFRSIAILAILAALAVAIVVVLQFFRKYLPDL